MWNEKNKEKKRTKEGKEMPLKSINNFLQFSVCGPYFQFCRPSIPGFFQRRINGHSSLSLFDSPFNRNNRCGPAYIMPMIGHQAKHRRLRVLEQSQNFFSFCSHSLQAVSGVLFVLVLNFPYEAAITHGQTVIVVNLWKKKWQLLHSKWMIVRIT